MRRHCAVCLLALFALAGCDNKDDSTPSNTDETGGEAVAPEDMPDGEYLMGFTISAVGLEIPFQAAVESVEREDGRAFATFSLRATDGVDTVSDVLVEVTDVPVAEDGTAEVDLGSFVLPAEWSPTSGDVVLDVELAVASSGPDGFCGDVGGMIVTFGIDLDGSTFGATPWADRAAGAEGACEASTEELTPMAAADCPALVAGTNSGFVSAGVERSFDIVVPSAYDAGQDWPVVFVFHGYGGAGSDMLGSMGGQTAADEQGVILIAPDAADRGGENAWDVFNDTSSNLDLMLVHDLVTCAGESWSVDPDRIYATGMSNGGLFTTLLLAQRSDLLASAAPFSGGLLGTMAADFRPLPVLVTWGGASDDAYQVDFNETNLELIDTLTGLGSFVVACDHGTGHSLDSAWWPYAFEFLLAHPMGVDPEPYADGLPETFPEWCGLATE